MALWETEVELVSKNLKNLLHFSQSRELTESSDPGSVAARRPRASTGLGPTQVRGELRRAHHQAGGTQEGCALSVLRREESVQETIVELVRQGYECRTEAAIIELYDAMQERSFNVTEEERA